MGPRFLYVNRVRYHSGCQFHRLKLLVISFAPIFWSHKTTHEEVTNTGPPQIQINRIGLLVLKLCLVEVYSVRRERERERALPCFTTLPNICR